MKALGHFTALTICVAAIGCSDSTGPTPITGTYYLTSYNGQTIPASISAGGCTQDINSGAFTLNREGTWEASITFEMSCSDGISGYPPVTVQDHGNYQREAAGLHLWIATTPPEDLGLAATDGDRLSLDLRPFYGALTQYDRTP